MRIDTILVQGGAGRNTNANGIIRKMGSEYFSGVARTTAQEKYSDPIY